MLAVVDGPSDETQGSQENQPTENVADDGNVSNVMIVTIILTRYEVVCI